MSTSRSIALLGGQSTGKSTYLGALGDALKAEELRHLRLAGLEGDARGLQRLSEPLHEGHYPPRTTSNERLELVARLRTHGTYFESLSFTLRAGDYDGEEVERLFRDRLRQWTSEWRQRALADGLLLLVRPNDAVRQPRSNSESHPNDMARWRMLHQREIIPASPGLQTQSTSARADNFFGSFSIEEVPPAPLAAPSDPVLIPTDLALVELLQFIRNVRDLAPGVRPRNKERFRVALVVTAWDAISKEWREAGPNRFLAHHLPLLQDYLWSNFLQDDIFRFGLSATGGDLRNPEYSQKYMDAPEGFVEWQDLGGPIRKSPDIGLPLYWLLFGDRALSAP